MTWGVTRLNSNMQPFRVKCHSTGCFGWPLTTGLYVFFSTMRIYYRTQMAKNNTQKVWFTHSDCIKQHKNGSVVVSELSSISCSCYGGLKRHIPAALCLARRRYSGTKIDFPPFSSQPCSVLLLRLKHRCDWKSFSQLDLPLVRQNPKRQNKTLFLTHHLIALRLFHTLKLAKWPWWEIYQLSIIDYQDFLHIHLRAPLSSLINISQKVVGE